MFNEDAPAAEAPKTNEDFIRFEPLPESGLQIMTILGSNYIKEYRQFNKEKQTEEVFPAVEIFLGTLIGDKPYFLKTWPMRYSINDRSRYYKYYKAALGKEPAAGSKPADLNGAGLGVTVKNEDKVSKKGTQYRVSKIEDVAVVHPKLKGEIIPADKLRPLLEKAVNEGKKEDGNAPF